jgi:hypothetical protein
MHAFSPKSQMLPPAKVLKNGGFRDNYRIPRVNRRARPRLVAINQGYRYLEDVQNGWLLTGGSAGTGGLGESCASEHCSIAPGPRDVVNGASPSRRTNRCYRIEAHPHHLP